MSGAVLVDGDTARAQPVARILSRLFVEVLWVGGEPPEGAPGVRVPADLGGPRSALGGLIAALDASSAERVLVAAAESPLLTPDLALALTAWPEREVVVPVTSAGPQPLCALYARDPARARAREQHARGATAIDELVEALDVDYVSSAELGVLE